jgi:hypothetical protein
MKVGLKELKIDEQLFRAYRERVLSPIAEID